MKWLFARLSEPSTWAGIAAAATQIAPAVATHNAVAIGVTLAGIVAAALPEKSAV